MWKRIRESLRRFAPSPKMEDSLESIATSLDIIRQLYELEMAHRYVPEKHTPAPLIRITEDPSKSDTEVFYTGEEEARPKSAIDKLKEQWNDIGSDDQVGE